MVHVKENFSSCVTYRQKTFQGQGGLLDYINQDYLPDWLNGRISVEMSEGGLVPKSYYMSMEEFEKDQSPGPHWLEESTYNSTTRMKVSYLFLKDFNRNFTNCQFSVKGATSRGYHKSYHQRFCDNMGL